MLLVMGLIYLLLNTLFAGGILEVFASDDGRFTMRRFWAGCGAYFWRFFRLLLIFVIVLWRGLPGLFSISKLIDSSAKQAAAYGQSFINAGRRWPCLLLLFALVNMIFDYAKISTVVMGRRKMFREAISATRFGAAKLLSALTHCTG